MSNEYSELLKGMERVDPNALVPSPLDGELERRFAAGNGVLKMWVDMPSELLEKGIRQALRNSKGQTFRVEHATAAEAVEILRVTGSN